MLGFWEGFQILLTCIVKFILYALFRKMNINVPTVAVY